MAELLLGSRVRLRIGSEILSSRLNVYGATNREKLSDPFWGILLSPRNTRVHAGILPLKGRLMAPHLPRTILVIDDEPSVVRALTGLLRRDGYVVGTASNGQHALIQSQERHYDVILCD